MEGKSNVRLEVWDGMVEGDRNKESGTTKKPEGAISWRRWERAHIEQLPLAMRRVTSMSETGGEEKRE